MDTAARCLAVASAFDEHYADTELYQALEAYVPNEVDLITENLISRLQVLEFLKPYYEEAQACGHPDAQRLLRGVEQELYSRRNPEMHAPVWG